MFFKPYFILCETRICKKLQKTTLLISCFWPLNTEAAFSSVQQNCNHLFWIHDSSAGRALQEKNKLDFYDKPVYISE